MGGAASGLGGVGLTVVSEDGEGWWVGYDEYMLLDDGHRWWWWGVGVGGVGDRQTDEGWSTMSGGRCIIHIARQTSAW